MIFCFALYPFTRGRVQVVLAYDILFCIIFLHTWSCTHCSSCPSVWYFVLHYIPSHVAVHALFMLSQRMVFCFALYPFTRGRARTDQVVLAYGILFCIISLHTWSCTHCSSCPSVWYFVLHYIPSHVVVHALFKLSQRMLFCFALYPFTRGRACTVQVVLAYDIRFCIISIHTWSCTHCSSCPSVWYFVLHYIPSHVVVHALVKLSQRMILCFASYPFTRGRARIVQVVLAYGNLFCIISLHTWSCTHCSCCPSVWHFVLHYIPSHVVVHALLKLSQRMVFCFALYPFTRGRARTVQVVLAYGILFCIISLHTWSCTHCSSCPSVWYFVLHYIPSHVVVNALFELFQRMVFCFALYPFTRGRERTVRVVLAYGILFCIISLHTWSCTHCSSCPSV